MCVLTVPYKAEVALRWHGLYGPKRDLASRARREAVGGMEGLKQANSEEGSNK